MLYREVIAIRSENHTQYVIALGGNKVEFLNVKLVVRKVVGGLSVGNVIAPSGASVWSRGQCFTDLLSPSNRNNAIDIHTTQRPPSWPMKYG